MDFITPSSVTKKQVPCYKNGHNPTPLALQLENVSVKYQATDALKDISFTLSFGERIAVLGPNGAGKSTLFKVIAGVLKPASGQVVVQGQQPDQRACIAYVPQRSLVDWQFPATVAEVVMMGRVGRIRLGRWARHQDWARVYQALDFVGLGAFAQRQIGALSGGQQQRVFIARAIAQEAELLLLDEPFNGLDIQAQEAILKILDMLQNHQVTVMVATHNINLAATHFDRLLLLKQRLIGFDKTSQILTQDLLSQVYGSQVHPVETARQTMIINETHYTLQEKG